MAHEEEVITEEDVKAAAAEFEKNIQEIGGTPEASSAKETPAGAPTPEVVKSETPEEKEPEVIPYSRFKEVNQKAKELEEYRELYEANKQYVQRDPATGKLRVVVPEETRQEVDESKRFEFDEEEKLALDEVQQRAITKLFQKNLYEQRLAAIAYEKEKREVETHWNQAKEEFPEVLDPKSKLHQVATEILRSKYVQVKKDGSTYTPPHAHYTSVLEAANRLRREAEAQKKVTIEEKKNQKTQAFVQTKATKETSTKTKYSDKELEKLSPSELQKLSEEEYYELHPDDRPDE